MSERPNFLKYMFPVFFVFVNVYIYQDLNIFQLIFDSSDMSFGLLTNEFSLFYINFNLYFVLFEIRHHLIHRDFCKKKVLFRKVFFKIALWNSPFFKFSLNRLQRSNKFSKWVSFLLLLQIIELKGTWTYFSFFFLLFYWINFAIKKE